MRLPQLGVTLPEKRYEQLKELSRIEQKSMSRIASEWIEEKLRESGTTAVTGKDSAAVTSRIRRDSQ